MMRLPLATAVAATAALLPGYSSTTPCAGVAGVDQAEESGQATPRAALDFLLHDPPKWVDRSGWHVGFRTTKTEETVTFVGEGGDVVKVVRSERTGRWYLDSYRGCR